MSQQAILKVLQSLGGQASREQIKTALSKDPETSGMIQYYSLRLRELVRSGMIITTDNEVFLLSEGRTTVLVSDDDLGMLEQWFLHTLAKEERGSVLLHQYFLHDGLKRAEPVPIPNVEVPRPVRRSRRKKNESVLSNETARPDYEKPQVV